MPLINAKPRFGLDGDSLYDYVAKKYIPIKGVLVTDEGIWDLPKVAGLISSGSSIETALTGNPGLPPSLTGDPDKVAQANIDFATEIARMSENGSPVDTATAAHQISDALPEAAIEQSEPELAKSE